MPYLLGIFGVGHVEILVVMVVILLLFGHRLPGLMRSLGRGVVEFKAGLSGPADDDSSAKTEKIADDRK